MTLALTLLALCAFAANSLLCRLALGAGHIDPASFTTLRILSGAVVLAPLALLRSAGASSFHGGPGGLRTGRPGGSWPAAIALALYAVPFSFAYMSLTAGTGALLLFGAVQGAMLAAGLLAGERPGAIAWTGFAVAVAGLLVLVSPGVTAPAPAGAVMMVVAGIAWGIYSLLGRGAVDPVAATAGNFLRAAPAALLVTLLARADAHADRRGVMLAIASGVFTSGIGYVLWYAALPRIGAMRAAIAQLAVPAMAALGGVIVLGETMTARLGAAAVLILGGIALALKDRSS